jgi:uncharacterized protein (TIRG00374 family)
MKKINLNKIMKFAPIIGIILFIYIIVDIGVEKIGGAFLSIPLQFYVLALLLFIPRLFVFVYKWQFISKKQRIDVGFWYLTKTFMVSLFYGSVTPGAIGWHMRIFYLKEKSKASLAKCITNSLIDSTTSFIAGLALALFGSLLVIEHFPGLFPILLVVFILYASAFIIFMKRERGNKIFNILIRPLLPRKYKESIDQSVVSLYEDLPQLRDMIFPILLELIVWMIAGTQTYIMALAFSIDIPYVSFMLISITAVIISSALPISIGGLGVREGAFVVLLAAFGVQPQTAFVISLSGFLVKVLLPGLVGLPISFKFRLKITD